MKRRILNEFVALTGYHRKHTIRVLNEYTGTSAANPRINIASIDLMLKPIEYYTRYNELNFSLGRVFDFGGSQKLRAGFDIFNILSSNTISGETAWE